MKTVAWLINNAPGKNLTQYNTPSEAFGEEARCYHGLAESFEKIASIIEGEDVEIRYSWEQDADLVYVRCQDDGVADRLYALLHKPNDGGDCHFVDEDFNDLRDAPPLIKVYR